MKTVAIENNVECFEDTYFFNYWFPAGHQFAFEIRWQPSLIVAIGGESLLDPTNFDKYYAGLSASSNGGPMQPQHPPIAPQTSQDPDISQSTDLSSVNVTIDGNGTVSSAFPTITGSATGVSQLIVEIDGYAPSSGSPYLSPFYQAIVPVVNGHWSFTASQANAVWAPAQGLKAGQYSVMVYKTVYQGESTPPLIFQPLIVAPAGTCQPSACWGHLGCNYEECTNADGSTYTKYVY
ncbi:MAG: hypothetical protein ACRDHZ_18535 [Ktedonobacteraceae bacterium]